jgi:hypothetical protein
MSKPKTDALEETFYAKLGVPLASLKQAQKAIEINRYTHNVICLVGDAGIGKTQIVQQVAAARIPDEPFDWKGETWEKSTPVRILYLAHMQAEDMGVPYPSRAKRNEILQECKLFLQIAEHTKGAKGQTDLHKGAREHALTLSRHLLDSGSPLDDGTFEFLVEKSLKDLPPEGILFLDEWNRADKATIKAFFTILEDRMVHGVPLVPPKVQIVAAMNPSDGAYSVNESEKDHAFRRRLSFVAVTVNPGTWLTYAEGRFHPYVVEFIKAQPTHLYDTKLRDAGKAFPCPATWEKVSDVLTAAESRGIESTDDGVNLTVSGIIGQTVANNFMAYVKDAASVIAPEEVLKKYTEKSAVRKKVTRLVKLARNDVLKELCSGISLILFSKQPDPATISMQLATFMGDLKSEMALAMIEHDFGSAASSNDKGEAYLGDLSKAMYTHDSYQGLFDSIANAMKTVRKEAKDEKLLDPLATP